MPAPRTKAITHDGKTLTPDEWAAATGIPAGTIRSRVFRLGWPPAKALATPPNAAFRPGKPKPRPAARPAPRLRRHQDGRAFARWADGGRRPVKYFGAWGSAEATTAYNRWAAEWVAAAGRPAPPKGAGLFLADLLVRRFEFAAGYYVKNGKATSEVHVHRSAFALPMELYGDTPAAEFTPERLRAVVAAWVAAGKSRKTVNEYAGRVKRAFKWAVGRSLVPPAVYLALAAVEGEAAGRSRAREPARKGAVAEAVVAKTLPHLHPDPARQTVLAALVRVQVLAGMRPGEACAMTPAALDAADPRAWRYDPGAANKNLHRGKPRVVWLGPRAQAELAPLLAGCPADAPVFRFAPLRMRRTAAARGYVPVRVRAYEAYVAAACKRAGVPHWSPHQLRKARATAVRDHYRSDRLAGLAIGDDTETARRHYLDADDEAARRVAAETG